MKLRIIFSEPPYNNVEASTTDEKVIAIRSSYKIIQESLGDTREYERVDGSKVAADSFTYEQYCDEMNKLISEAVSASGLANHGPYDGLIIEGFQQPPNFKTVCSAIGNASLSCAPNSQLTFKDCSFGGALYVNSTTHMINALKNTGNISFKVTLDQTDTSKLSAHDEARLASLNGVAFFRDKNSNAAMKPFTDDALIGIKNRQGMTKLDNPTYHYRQAIREIGSPASILKSFFSMEAQQQNDYTCGPATIKMVAKYFDSMGNRNFCGAPIADKSVWREIDKNPEMLLAEQVKTTESDGSDIPDMREGLVHKGLTVFDDNGLSNIEHTEDEINAHKELLWNKMQDIVKLGVPVILNMQDREGCGHFEVVIGIEKTATGEHIILAEPGTALSGALEFEHVPKDQFIDRWKNMSGEYHGRFIVLPPNPAAAKAIESVLEQVPHFTNGEEVKPASGSNRLYV